MTCRSDGSAAALQAAEEQRLPFPSSPVLREAGASLGPPGPASPPALTPVVHVATLPAPRGHPRAHPRRATLQRRGRRVLPLPHTVVSLFQRPVLIPATPSALARLTSYLLPLRPPLWLATLRG